MSMSEGTSSVDKCVQVPPEEVVSNIRSVKAPDLIEDASRLLGIIDNVILVCGTRPGDLQNGRMIHKPHYRSRLGNLRKMLDAIVPQIGGHGINEATRFELHKHFRGCEIKAKSLFSLLRGGSSATEYSILGKLFPVLSWRKDYKANKLVDGMSNDLECLRGNMSLIRGSQIGVRSKDRPLLSPSVDGASIVNPPLRDRQDEVTVKADKCTKAIYTPFEKVPQSKSQGWPSEYSNTDYARSSDIKEELQAGSRVDSVFQHHQNGTDEIMDTCIPPLTDRDGSNEEEEHRNLDYYVNKTLLPFLPYLEKLSTLPQLPSYGYIRPDPEWIDLYKIQNWINICDLQHSNHCQYIDSSDDTAAKPLWLVDVVRSCLVPATQASRYVALSYVWGSAEATSSTLASLENLQKDNYLLSEQAVLPRTVRHAIRLTQMLGENYLWVDRLCIVQDDEKSKAQQINSMAMIYASSYFTVVAAQGKNADDGLRGIQDVTPRRHLAGQSPLEYLDHYEAFSAQSRQLKETNWYKRGWTFQEHLFSRRKLIFQNDTVNWECHCAAWYENQEMLENPSSIRACTNESPTKYIDIDSKTWPDFHRYARLVCLYNERSLTFPEDVLDAFTGVTTALGPNFDGGFLSGLPQMFFDAALLWQPYRPLVRRQGLRTSKSIPSWSWIGWKGDLHSESWRSGYDYIKVSSDDPVESIEWLSSDRKGTSWQTKSTVNWHFSEDRESQQYRLTVTSQRFRHMDISAAADLPEGWSKHHEDDTEYYKHVSDANQEFWYPIPLPGSFTVSQPLLQPAFLHGRTRVCNSLLFGASFTNPETSRCLSYDLVDRAHQWVGTLRLNIRASAKSVDKQTGSGCILVEISSGSVCNRLSESMSFDEWYRPECPRRHGLYEFYNVLQVQMVEGVAYRMALGRVVKSVWDELAGVVDICLG